MRTFKQIGLGFIVIAFGLMLVGCDSYKAYFASSGVQVSVSGANENKTRITVGAGENTFDTTEPDRVYWYYDVKEADPEYVLIDERPDGFIIGIYVHKHKTAMPPNFGK